MSLGSWKRKEKLLIYSAAFFLVYFYKRKSSPPFKIFCESRLFMLFILTGKTKKIFLKNFEKNIFMKFINRHMSECVSLWGKFRAQSIRPLMIIAMFRDAFSIIRTFFVFFLFLFLFYTLRNEMMMKNFKKNRKNISHDSCLPLKKMLKIFQNIQTKKKKKKNTFLNFGFYENENKYHTRFCDRIVHLCLKIFFCFSFTLVEIHQRNFFLFFLTFFYF